MHELPSERSNKVELFLSRIHYSDVLMLSLSVHLKKCSNLNPLIHLKVTSDWTIELICSNSLVQFRSFNVRYESIITNIVSKLPRGSSVATPSLHSFRSLWTRNTLCTACSRHSLQEKIERDWIISLVITIKLLNVKRRISEFVVKEKVYQTFSPVVPGAPLGPSFPGNPYKQINERCALHMSQF